MTLDGRTNRAMGLAENMTQAETAHLIGVTPGAVDQAERKAIRKLRWPPERRRRKRRS